MNAVRLRREDYGAWLASRLDAIDFDCLTHGLIREFQSGDNRNLGLLVEYLIRAENEAGDTPMGELPDVRDLLRKLTRDVLDARAMQERREYP